jgi:hypothetical protein
MSDTRVPVESIQRKRDRQNVMLFLLTSTVVMTAVTVILLKKNKSFDVDYNLLFEKYANLQDEHEVLIDSYLMLSDRALRQYETLAKTASSVPSL